jgi:PadR family transcriptional regulator AphA
VSDPVNLTTVSYVVLGLVACAEPVTSYEMKRMVAVSIGNFWPFPHSQLYAEPARLSAAGLLDTDVERTGRKRRRYRLTPDGRQALGQWLATPTSDPSEIRDHGLLKLFFEDQGRPADLVALATAQQEAHQARRDEYAALHASIASSVTPWSLAPLEMGLRFEQLAVDFWSEVATGRYPGRPVSRGRSGASGADGPADSRHPDAEGRIGGVDHLPAADVDADVMDVAVEEDKIPGL